MILRKCNHGYTLNERCNICGETKSAHPPRYSPKNAELRMKAKLKALKDENE